MWKYEDCALAGINARFVDGYVGIAQHKRVSVCAGSWTTSPASNFDGFLHSGCIKAIAVCKAYMAAPSLSG